MSVLEYLENHRNTMGSQKRQSIKRVITIETRKERSVRDKKRMSFLENSISTKEAREAFHHKPYQCIRGTAVEYVAEKYKICEMGENDGGKSKTETVPDFEKGIGTD